MVPTVAGFIVRTVWSREGEIKMQRILFAIVLAASTALGTHVVTAEEPIGQGFGLGMSSCAEFAAQYRESPTIVELGYLGWAEGFMSALNLQATISGLPAKSFSGIDIEALKIELRSYCDKHPLAAYYMAVTDAYLGRPLLPKKSN